MDIASSIVVYVLLWWFVFFLALPIGVRTPGGSEIGRGHADSAPVRPHLRIKAWAATAIAAALWGVVYLLIDADLYSFRDAVSGW